MATGDGVLLYKCRACGNVFDGPEVPHVLDTVRVLAIVGFEHVPVVGMVRLTGVHDCGGRVRGVADLIGGNAYDEPRSDDGEQAPG